MHREPNVGFDPGSPGSRPGPKAGGQAPPSCHPLQPTCCCQRFCFLGLPFQPWAAWKSALFKGCEENWEGGVGGIYFFLLNQC
uniref:Uncharacterized protein n=1 Tax=Canis lupus familiaris TaxID=9615 RepID=A0A8I3NLW9_CANLF